MTDQTHCREFTAAEVEVEAAYIGQFHSEQAARTRDMLDAFARMLRNTRAQASAPEGGEVGVGVDHTEDGTNVAVRIGNTIAYSQFHPYTRSNAKAGEVNVPEGYAVCYRYWDGWPICARCQTGNQNEPLLEKIERLAKEKCTKCGAWMLDATKRGDGSEMGVGNG